MLGFGTEMTPMSPAESLRAQQMLQEYLASRGMVTPTGPLARTPQQEAWLKNAIAMCEASNADPNFVARSQAAGQPLPSCEPEDVWQRGQRILYAQTTPIQPAIPRPTVLEPGQEITPPTEVVFEPAALQAPVRGGIVLVAAAAAAAVWWLSTPRKR